MICETCKFANWELTVDGRKHPSGKGNCMWTGTLRVAGSMYSIKGYGHPITKTGDIIFRKKGSEHPTKCDVYQKVGTK
jgi:hypothetical protein